MLAGRILFALGLESQLVEAWTMAMKDHFLISV